MKSVKNRKISRLTWKLSADMNVLVNSRKISFREMGFVERVRQHVKEKGVPLTLLWIIVRFLTVMRSVFYQAVFYNIAVFDLKGPGLQKVKAYEDLLIRQLRTDDLITIGQLFGKKLSDEFRLRLEHSTCYTVYNGGNFAGYSWVSSKKLRDEGSRPFLFDVLPQQGYCYIYKTFIVPEQRNKDLCTILYDYILHECRCLGIDNVFFLFNVRNLAMKSVVLKLGFQIIGCISHRRYLWVVLRNTMNLRKVCDMADDT